MALTWTETVEKGKKYKTRIGTRNYKLWATRMIRIVCCAAPWNTYCIRPMELRFVQNKSTSTIHPSVRYAAQQKIRTPAGEDIQVVFSVQIPRGIKTVSFRVVQYWHSHLRISILTGCDWWTASGPNTLNKYRAFLRKKRRKKKQSQLLNG